MTLSQDPKVLYENSMRLPEQVFPVAKVQEEMDRILAQKFDGKKYDPKDSVKLLTEASSEISSSIRKIIPPEFKYAVHATLSERIGQAFFAGTMCLWDPEHDNYATVKYDGTTFTVVVVVFCSLLE